MHTANRKKGFLRRVLVFVRAYVDRGTENTDPATAVIARYFNAFVFVILAFLPISITTAILYKEINRALLHVLLYILIAVLYHWTANGGKKRLLVSMHLSLLATLGVVTLVILKEGPEHLFMRLTLFALFPLAGATFIGVRSGYTWAAGATIALLLSITQTMASPISPEKFPTWHRIFVYNLAGVGLSLGIGVSARKFADDQAFLLQEARDQAINLAKMKSEFLANMSHEIRTPMNGVLGMTELLLHSDLTPEQRDFVGIVRSSGESLLTLVNDILDMSKIESGKFHLEHIEVDISRLTEDTVLLFAEKAQKKNLEIACWIHTGTPAFVIGDPTRLRQILTNLLNNAVKFTSEGEITVHVQPVKTERVRLLPALSPPTPQHPSPPAPPPADTSLEAGTTQQTHEQICLRFSVTDTGIGIAHESQKRLFQAFEQAHTSTTREFGGTGLGLTICKQLVTLMGGIIEVESTKGKGSTFSFEIPFSLQTAGRSGDSPPLPPLAPLTNEKGLEPQTAVIINDSPIVQGLLTEYLAEQGISAYTATAQDAENALTKARQNTSACPFLFLNYETPHTNASATVSHETAAENFATRLDTFGPAPLRVLLLTNMAADLAPREHAMVQGIVRKPVRKAQLHTLIHKVLHDEHPQTTKDHKPSTALPEKNAQPPIAPVDTKEILVVDDNPVNRQIACKHLQHLGYNPIQATNGLEALYLIDKREKPLHAILMDCHMPILDGWGATREIRRKEHEQELPPTHIIALTAQIFTEDIERCHEIGMNGYLAKPYSRDELEQALVSRETRAALPLEITTPATLPAHTKDSKTNSPRGEPPP